MVLDNTGPMPGRYSTDFTPMVRWFFDGSETPGVSRVTGQISAQSAKTQTMINKCVRTIAEDPGPAMWVGATKDNAEEFAQKRLFPAVEQCAKTAALLPKEKRKRSKKLIQFDSMNLMLRGTESRIGLQSDPVRYIFCDERREWKRGAIDLLRKRTRTFYNAIEIGIGTAGDEGDELDSDFRAGSQTHAHFNCLACGYSQPFRFGKTESSYFPKPRERGGLVWDESDITRPCGSWGDYEEVKKTVRFECESCGHRHHNTDKLKLVKTLHPVDYNPKAPKKFKSYHWNALAMLWAECDWALIVEEFLRAAEESKRGNIEPLRAFITETLGEPFQKKSLYKQKGDLIERIGAYKLGEYWLDPDGQREKGTALILTFDRQQDHLPYVVRQVRKNGQSRLVHLGKSASLDDLRAVQMELKILNQCMWGDDGGLFTNEFRQKCLQWNWNILKGEDWEHFTIQHREDGVDKSYRQGWRETKFDAGIGTTREGFATVKAWLWSNPWFKDRLYFSLLRGLGPLWEIPSDVPTEYLEQVNANELRERTSKANGQKETYFHETGADHFADCELMQDVVVSIAGWNRTVHQPQSKPNPS